MFNMIARILITAADVYFSLLILSISANDESNKALSYVLSILIVISNIALIWL